MVDPSRALGNQRQIDVPAAAVVNHRDEAPVAVGVVHIKIKTIRAAQQLRQRTFRLGAIGLFLLWRIDRREPNPVTDPAVRRPDVDGVAIGNPFKANT
ncbi:hypothetical protein SSTU70S_04759 [Stutzerimonas stutzeri]